MFKSGTKSVSEIIGLLLRMPNQNTNIKCITTMQNVIVLTNDYNVYIIPDDGGLLCFDNDPTIWDREPEGLEPLQIDETTFNKIVSEYGL